jgi:hypothetical protein
MKYYAARQRATTKKWDYICMNDGQRWAVGYCSGKYPTVQDDESLEHRECYHEDGHETAEEARECYKRYMLDNRLHLDGKMANQQMRCQVEQCDAWTQGTARLGGYTSFTLCDEHRNRETVEKLYDVFESWSS